MKMLALVALALFPLCAAAQTMREGFEEWKDRDGAVAGPVGWSGVIFGLGREDSAYSGNYAASVWNWYGDVVGYIITGDESHAVNRFDRAGIPIDFVPTRLTGYYKYELGDNRRTDDSAAVYVMLKRYDVEQERMDTIAYVTHLLPPSETWTPFTVELPLRIAGVQPDSVVIAFYSSNPKRSARCAGATCCYFSIDEISLTSTSGVSYNLHGGPVPMQVSPNPVVNASARLTFEGEEGTSYGLKIYDVSGGLVLEREVIGSEVELSNLDLRSGSYYVSIADRNHAPVAGGRFVVE